jgi:cell division septum initiation protein DivIVA
LTTNEHNASAGDGINGAARLVEVAARNADELLGEARAEVASITATARADAERVHAELEKMRAVQNDELDQHRATVMAELAERRAAIEAEVLGWSSLNRKSGLGSATT